MPTVLLNTGEKETLITLYYIPKYIIAMTNNDKQSSGLRG